MHNGTLLVAFALIWGFVLFASAVAIQALSEVAEIVSGVTQQRASTIVESSRLAQQAERAITVAITAARPISTVTDEALFRRQIDEIQRAEDELLAARQALLLGQAPDRNALLAPVGEVLASIRALIDATGERLKMRASVAVAVAADTNADLSFQRAAAPTQRAFGSDVSGMNANGQGSDYRKELTVLYRFDQVQRSFAKVHRTLLSASQSPSVVDLNLQAIVLRREVADLVRPSPTFLATARRKSDGRLSTSPSSRRRRTAWCRNADKSCNFSTAVRLCWTGTT